MRPLAIAIQFLTRIPIRVSGIPDEKEISASLNYYPVVGLLLGLLLTLSAWFLHVVPDLLNAALTTAIWVLLTGALHLDGLADSADAWIGGLGDREKTLRIMKDPACGPAGVTAIVVLLLVKFSTLFSIIQADKVQLLFLAPLLSRTAVMLLIAFTPNAKQHGLAESLTRHINRKLAIGVSVCVFLFVSLAIGLKSSLLLPSLVAVVLLIRQAIMQRLQGITGDLAGAVVEISEVSLLLTLLAL